VAEQESWVGVVGGQSELFTLDYHARHGDYPLRHRPPFEVSASRVYGAICSSTRRGQRGPARPSAGQAQGLPLKVTGRSSFRMRTRPGALGGPGRRPQAHHLLDGGGRQRLAAAAVPHPDRFVGCPRDRRPRGPVRGRPPSTPQSEAPGPFRTLGERSPEGSQSRTHRLVRSTRGDDVVAVDCCAGTADTTPAWPGGGTTGG